MSTLAWVDLHPFGANESIAISVHSGVQVGYIEKVFQYRACLWTGSAASYVDLHPMNAAHSWCYDVFNGVQAGAVKVSGGQHAAICRGTPDSWEYLPSPLTPGGTWNELTATSLWFDEARTVVGGYGRYKSGSTPQAILWTRWNDGPCLPDCDQSGGLDIDDFICFQTAYAIGC